MIRIIIDREAAAQHGVTGRRYTCSASSRRSNDRTRVGCCDIQAVECDTAIQTPVRVVWCNNTPTPRLTRGPLLVQCQLDTDSREAVTIHTERTRTQRFAVLQCIYFV